MFTTYTIAMEIFMWLPILISFVLYVLQMYWTYTAYKNSQSILEMMSSYGQPYYDVAE